MELLVRENLQLIMGQGFKVGGEGVVVSNGAVHGVGVYCTQLQGPISLLVATTSSSWPKQWSVVKARTGPLETAR
jgi:hypothetical protein